MRSLLREKLILALDVDSMEEASKLVQKMSHLVGIFKVGPQLFTRYGPRIIELIKKQGAKIFYDAKFYDISSVVEKAAQAVGEMKVDMFTLHTLGGSKMMEIAAKAARKRHREVKILGVTLLTSLNSRVLKEELRIEKNLEEEVIRLAKLAKRAGLDGVISSPREIEALRKALGKNFLLVTPGIRPAWMRGDEQKRIMTPGEAIRKGADFLVVGRPILTSPDPLKTTKEILEEMEKGINYLEH